MLEGALRFRKSDGILGVPAGSRQLEHRIVRQVRKGEGGYSRQQGLGLDVVPSLDRGPFALPLTQGDPVLDYLGLRRVDVERLLESVFRRAVLIEILQNPADLLKGHQLVPDG